MTDNGGATTGFVVTPVSFTTTAPTPAQAPEADVGGVAVRPVPPRAGDGGLLGAGLADRDPLSTSFSAFPMILVMLALLGLGCRVKARVH
jgi:hypothetical protein